MSLAVAGILAASNSHAANGADSTENFLKVDPLMVAQAAEVWKHIAVDDSKVWPGWNASTTPLLFYIPKQQDVLINHPSPPAGFELYKGEVTFPNGVIYVKNNETIIGFDGQNTSTDVNGVETLVVADTLSNGKNRISGFIFDPRKASEKIEELSYQDVGSDPYETMAMIAHEAFHVFQDLRAGDKRANELALKNYPTLSVDNNLGFSLEGNALSRALKARTTDEATSAAIEWLAVRNHRRSQLSEEDIAYEDGTEFNEGLAKYVEYRLSQVMEGSKPGEMMYWMQGFHGFDDLSGTRDKLLDVMSRHMQGKVNVNNDPYGAAPLRLRFYYSGMAIAALLDRLEVTWHEEILQPGTTLTGLLAAHLKASDGALDRAYKQALSTPGYQDIRAEKQALFEAGRDRAKTMQDEILHGENTLVVIDYSELDSPQIGMGFSPFGIVRVDDDHTIYSQSPVSARVRPETHFQQSKVSRIGSSNALFGQSAG